MYLTSSTDVFDAWLETLDKMTRMIVIARLDMVRLGSFGDRKSLGGGVSELRIHRGSGYRIYYTLQGRELVLLLAGGDKSSQTKDIARAKDMVKQLR
jgi:putative addiction module killer protein